MRHVSFGSIVACLALVLIAAGCGGSSGGDDSVAIFSGPSCPNDANWLHHLTGPSAYAVPDTHTFTGQPSVAMAPDGSFVVAWATSTMGVGGVYAQRYAADGSPDGGPVNVGDPSHTVPTKVDVALNATGTMIIAYPSADGVIYAMRDNTGVVVKAPTAIAGTGSGGQVLYRSPRVGIADDGSCVVVHMIDDLSASTPNVVVATYLGPDGIQVGPQVPVSDPAGEPDARPSGTLGLAVAGDGSHVIAWADYEGTARIRFYDSRVPAAGNPTASPDLGPLLGVSDPAVAIAPDGRFVIGWLDDNYVAHLQTYDALSAKSGSVQQVNQTDSLQWGAPESPRHFLSLAMNGDGNIAASWAREQQDLHQFMVRRFGPTGTPIGDEEAVFPATTMPVKEPPAVAASTCLDNHVVVFRDIANGFRTRFQLYQADDDDDGQPDDCCGP